MYFPWNWEFGSALSKLWNFGGFDPPPAVCHWPESSGKPISFLLHCFNLKHYTAVSLCCHHLTMHHSNKVKLGMFKKCHYLNMYVFFKLHKSKIAKLEIVQAGV
jgi:hypothetical protein